MAERLSLEIRKRIAGQIVRSFEGSVGEARAQSTGELGEAGDDRGTVSTRSSFT